MYRGVNMINKTVEQITMNDIENEKVIKCEISNYGTVTFLVDGTKFELEAWDIQLLTTISANERAKQLLANYKVKTK